MFFIVGFSTSITNIQLWKNVSIIATIMINTNKNIQIIKIIMSINLMNYDFFTGVWCGVLWCRCLVVCRRVVGVVGVCCGVCGVWCVVTLFSTMCKRGDSLVFLTCRASALSKKTCKMQQVSKTKNDAAWKQKKL